VQMQYATTFLVNWPRHLGGRSVHMDLEGSLVLMPLLSM
jgi:hypothetical protein